MEDTVRVITLTESEFAELHTLLAEEINDTSSNRKARVLRNLQSKLDASEPERML